MTVVIQACASVEHPGWLSLRSALWPLCSKAEHLAEMTEFVAQPERFAQFVACTPAREPAGLIEVSIRTDYVNGTESSPVAFIEGLYVTPAHRRKGIARRLVAAAGAWAAAQRCTEIAADTPLENKVSQRMHKALGFEETERVVFFRKALEE